MIRPSEKHNNKSAVNWLVYDLGDKLIQKYKKFYKGKLYDLGCGEKPYKEYFLQYVDEYIGVDWSDTLHDLKADIVADLNKPLPIEDEVADTLISFSVLEHLCEPQTLLNEAYRILKKDGYFILQVPWQWSVHEAPYDYFRYTPYRLKYLFEKAGFKEVEITPNAAFFTMWLLKINYFSSRFIRGPKPLRFLIKGMLLPFWTINQLLAPLLDKLDRHPDLETGGYTVVARKS
jgi:SAM-dependent methyltransferase